MATGDNMMDLALQITADPSQAEKALAEFSSQVKGTTSEATAATQQLAGAQREANATAQAMQRTIAQSLEQQGASAEEAAQIYRQMGMSGAQAAAEIRSAFGETAAAEEATGAAAETAGERGARGANLWHSMNQGVIGDLRLMRYSMYAFTTPLMFSYMIPQIGRMVQGIRDGISAMEGLDAESQKVVDTLAKSPPLLQQLAGLTIQAQIADVRLAMAQEELSLRTSEAIIKMETATTASQNYASMLSALGALAAGNVGPLSELVSRYFEKAHAVTDAAKATAKYNSYLSDLGKLEKELQKETSKSKTETDKFAVSQQHLGAIIATAQVKLPPYIAEIERLQQALLVPEAKANNTLFAYAELNAERLQQKLAPLAATFQQLGIAVPTITPTETGSALAAEIQHANTILDSDRKLIAAQHALTDAQRMALPTERELALANAELAREYPNLTEAERKEWAQVMLTSDAYRQHIDTARQVHSSNAMLAGSFSALAMQVRTAFSEMAGQLTGWGGVATRVFDQVFNAISRQIEIERRQAAEHQITQFSMIKATIDGFKQLAPVRAAIDLAKGFEALGDLNFWSATQYFAGAALWGTVAAFQIASMAGAFQPGASGSKAVASAGSSTTAAAPTAGPLTPGSASSQPATIQVDFQGDVYGTGGIREVVRKINQEVDTNRLKLVASHTLYGRSLA